MKTATKGEKVFIVKYSELDFTTVMVNGKDQADAIKNAMKSEEWIELLDFDNDASQTVTNIISAQEVM